MLDDDGHAINIDFDSCAYIGAKSRGGTPWVVDLSDTVLCGW